MVQLDLVGIVVKDMAAALRFYRMLGLDIPTSADAEQHAEVVLANGFRIAWDSLEMMKDIYPDWTDAVGHRMTLAFKCSTPAAVDTLYNQIIESGYQGYKAPWDAFWGQRYAVVIDPDGNLIDLFAGL